MIVLKVESYCHGCKDFEPLVNRITYTTGSGQEMTDTEIFCLHAKRCDAIADYIKMLNKEDDKDPYSL